MKYSIILIAAALFSGCTTNRYYVEKTITSTNYNPDYVRIQQVSVPEPQRVYYPTTPFCSSVFIGY